MRFFRSQGFGLCQSLLIIFIAIFFTSVPANSAELIEVPGGVVVRSLYDWENSAALEAISGSRLLGRQGDHNRIWFRFSHKDLCDNPSYAIKIRKDGLEEDYSQSLGHLCRKEKDEPLKFAFIADSQEFQTEHAKTARLINELYAANPDMRFIINGGDLIQWSRWVNWKRYRIVTSLYSSYLPIVPVVGNHQYYFDSQLEAQNKVYSTETNAKHYYLLDYDIAALIVLNSNMTKMTVPDKEAQDEWLKQTLERLKGRKNIFVTYHHATVTSGYGMTYMPANPRYIEDKWIPLFEEYGVRMILNGHEHLYERSLRNGIVYVVAGPAGGRKHNAGLLDNPYRQVAEPDYRTVTLVTVQSDERVHIKTYAVYESKLIDDYTF